MDSKINCTPPGSDLFHFYLKQDHILCIFKILAVADPIQLFRSCRVCKLWKHLINQESLWNHFRQRFSGIINSSSGSSLLDSVKIICMDMQHISRVVKENLLTCTVTSEWALKKMLSKVERFPEDHRLRMEYQALFDKQHNQWKEVIDKLKAAFYGHLSLREGGYGSLIEARKIAEVLASRRFLETKPLLELEEIEQQMPK